MDKLEKIGEVKVKEELTAKGFDAAKLKLVFEILNFQGSAVQKIHMLKTQFERNADAMKSVEGLIEVLTLLKEFGETDQHVEIDLSLARGLSYYTGCIFEVKIQDATIGSVSGGGRYDNLTAVFDSKEKSSGVGFSFGVDRLYDAMEELNLFPEETEITSRILVCHLDGPCRQYSLKIVQSLRNKGVSAEVYPDLVKLKKQLEYADRKKIPFAIVIGSDEMKSGTLAFKNMKTGEQLMLKLEQILSKL